MIGKDIREYARDRRKFNALRTRPARHPDV